MTSRLAQCRSASLAEATANVIVGYGVALGAQQLIFPAFGLVTTLGQDSAIAALFTLVSLSRSYLVRRGFERIGTGMGRGRRLQTGHAYRLAAEEG